MNSAAWVNVQDVFSGDAHMFCGRVLKISYFFSACHFRGH